MSSMMLEKMVVFEIKFSMIISGLTLCCLALFPVVCLGSKIGANSNFARAILARHNCYREGVADVPALTWSEELAQEASAIVAKHEDEGCSLWLARPSGTLHTPEPGAPSGPKRPIALVAADAVDDWYSRIKFYRFKPHHYYHFCSDRNTESAEYLRTPHGIQMFVRLMWAEARHVGCTYKECPDGGSGNYSYMVLCQYSPDFDSDKPAFGAKHGDRLHCHPHNAQFGGMPRCDKRHEDAETQPDCSLIKLPQLECLHDSETTTFLQTQPTLVASSPLSIPTDPATTKSSNARSSTHEIDHQLTTSTTDINPVAESTQAEEKVVGSTRAEDEEAGSTSAKDEEAGSTRAEDKDAGSTRAENEEAGSTRAEDEVAKSTRAKAKDEETGTTQNSAELNAEIRPTDDAKRTTKLWRNEVVEMHVGVTKSSYSKIDVAVNYENDNSSKAPMDFSKWTLLALMTKREAIMRL